MSVHSSAQPSEGKRPYLRKAERREQILAAALEVFVVGGYHGTHVSDVVERAGVARGTFYLHFESKHAVFSALVERMLEVFIALPREPWEEAVTADDARRLLTQAYHSTFATFREHRSLCRLLFDEAVGIDKGFRDRLEDHYRAWRERIVHMLACLGAAGLTRADVDAEVTSELVIGMVERITRRYLLADEEPDLDRLVAAVVDLELRGVA